ncbi:MAG: DNA-binding transcriptional regulator GbsR (MarR family) [Saprospiraceae bacterium]
MKNNQYLTFQYSIMELQRGKERFIQSWGAFGSSWGINRTMAQVHALLLISQESLSAEEIMEELQISRGNANMNVRALIDWGLVYKDLQPGERKEFFKAEKDMSVVVKQIITHRKKKELEPMLKVLDEISSVENVCEESKEFTKVVSDIKLFSSKADSVLDKLIKADSNWLLSTFLKMVK